MVRGCKQEVTIVYSLLNDKTNTKKKKIKNKKIIIIIIIFFSR